MYPRFLFNPMNCDDIRDYNECIVIGSGIAGLSTAIRLSNHEKIKIFTKSALSESNTWYAQGGIAAVIKGPDSWEDHYRDTMKSGQGLCDTEAVKTLVKSAPEMVEDLIENGIHFDIANGEIGLTLEGGHSSPRVLHAGGDATGEEIERKLIIFAKQLRNIEFYPENFVLDILTYNNECTGIVVLNIKEGKVEIHPASNIILSTGGVGQLFELTTNPSVSTGDGIAMAYRAGAEIKDIEFIQFHPTVFKTNDSKLFLITEALRGEGAFLKDINGNRFMLGKHPLAELAPRDIVVKEMTMVMKEQGTDFVYLDATHLDRHMLTIRFPNIVNKLKDNGLDLKTDLIKVSPAAHYLNGGIKTSLDGETNIKGIYACGETAATGAHGANRLASNSLMEGLVYGNRIYESIISKIHDKNKYIAGNPEVITAKDGAGFRKILQKIVDGEETRSGSLFLKDNKNLTSSGNSRLIRPEDIDDLEAKLRHLMTNRVGILREGKRLKNVLEFVNENLAMQSLYERKEKDPNEFLNMLLVAKLIITAAILRTESRGTHQRCDYPETDDKNWKKHIIQKNDEIYFEPVT